MANEKAPKQSHKYTVNSVTERTIPDRTRGFKSVMEITYTSERGNTRSVNVPSEIANPDTVAQAIIADIEAMEAIFRLGQ